MVHGLKSRRQGNVFFEGGRPFFVDPYHHFLFLAPAVLAQPGALEVVSVSE